MHRAQETVEAGNRKARAATTNTGRRHDGDGRVQGQKGRRTALTLEEGADLPPSSNTPLAAILAQRHLQKEHRDATAEEEDEVGDEKSSWGKKGRV